MSVIELNIKKPTTISAGAVAKDGIAVKIGAKNIDSANSTAAVIEVRPVLPPAATPAEDSTNVVVVEELHLLLWQRRQQEAQALSAEVCPFHQAYLPLNIRR